MKNESSKPLENTTDYNNVPDHIQNKPNIYRTISMIDVSIIIFCLIISTAHYFSSPKNPQYTTEEHPAITIIRETSPAETSPVTEKTEKTTATSVSVTQKEEPAVDYEKIYNDFIKNDLVQANGLAALNPCKPSYQKIKLEPRLVPEESLGLVSAYVSDFNNDNMPELVSITLNQESENYIWKIQCFSCENNKQIQEISSYEHKQSNIYIPMRNNVFRAEISDGYLIISYCYSPYEGVGGKIIALDLTDLSLNKVLDAHAFYFEHESFSFDSYNDPYTFYDKKEGIKILSQKLDELGIIYSNITPFNDSGVLLSLSNSVALTYYDVQTDLNDNTHVFYPNDYSGLYNLLGKEKSNEILYAPEPEIQEKYFYTDQGYAYVNTSEGPLNLRSSPSTSSDILTSIPKGTRIKVYSFEKRDWYYTNYENQNGYVSADFISFKEPEKPVERIDQGSITDFDLDNDGTNDRIDIWYDKNATMCPVNWDVYYSNSLMKTFTFYNGADNSPIKCIVHDNNIGETYIAEYRTACVGAPIMHFKRMENDSMILEVITGEHDIKTYTLNNQSSSFEEVKNYSDNIEILYSSNNDFSHITPF